MKLLLALITLILSVFGPGCSELTTGTEPEKEATLPYTYTGAPLRVGVVGLTHTHVHWILGRGEVGDIELVGIVEPNRDLAKQYSDLHGYSMEIVYDTMEEMVAATKPEVTTRLII